MDQIHKRYVILPFPIEKDEYKDESGVTPKNMTVAIHS
jgi:hypothetical protein